jgi:hypothetical protein
MIFATSRRIQWIVLAGAVSAFLLVGLGASPAYAAPSPNSATACTVSPTTQTINAGETKSVTFSYSGGTPDVFGRTFLWYEYSLDGEAPTAFRWTESGSSDTYVMDYGHVFPGQVLTETWYAINTSLNGSDGSALCTITTTYGPALYGANYGHSDKTSSPKDRDRSSFSDDASGPKPKKR